VNKEKFITLKFRPGLSERERCLEIMYMLMCELLDEPNDDKRNEIWEKLPQVREAVEDAASLEQPDPTH